MHTMTTSNLQIRRTGQMAASAQSYQRTSGINCNLNAASKLKNQQDIGRVKTLTNFSIDSIIGQEEDRRNNQHSQSREQQSREAKPQFVSISEPGNGLMQQKTTGNFTSLPANRLAQPVQEIKKHRPKNFQCPACCMAFSNNGQLKNHVRIHTGERPFECNHFSCGKTFTRNEELTRHKLIHTGARPHACPSCSKRFGRKDHLKKHVKTHERKKLRKSCYAPRLRETHPERAKRIHDSCELTNDSANLFSPKKQMSDEKQSTSSSRLDAPCNIPVPIQTQYLTGTQCNQFSMALLGHPPHPPPPVTLSAPHKFIDQSTARTMAAIANSGPLDMLSAATSGPLHQIGDYWQKWYNFLGLYHHP